MLDFELGEVTKSYLTKQCFQEAVRRLTVLAKPDIKLTIISDNRLRLLKLSEYNDFLKEYPSKVVDF